MLLKQEFQVDGNQITLRNTHDIGAAKSLAHDSTQAGGEGNDTFRAMGHIPTEMWAYNPWLIAASKARACGDRQGYSDNIRKFFEVYPCFRVEHRQKYFNLGGI